MVSGKWLIWTIRHRNPFENAAVSRPDWPAGMRSVPIHGLDAPSAPIIAGSPESLCRVVYVIIFDGSTEKTKRTECGCYKTDDAVYNTTNSTGVAWACRLFALFLILLPAPLLGAEIRAFKLTGVKGELGFGYELNDLETKSADGTTTFERRPTSEQELTVTTSSYAFHPNLLEMELGGGMRFVQESLENEKGSNDRKESLYSFSSSLQFLKYKPYPFRLYYDQRNPTHSVGLADSLTTEAKSYGLDAQLRNPLVAFPVQLSARHNESSGEGKGTVIDDTVDSVLLSISGSISDLGTTSLDFTHVSQESASGSQNLPIQATQQDTQGMAWDTKLTFGEQRNINFLSLVSHDINEHSDLEKREDSRLGAFVDWDHDKTLRSFYRYNLTSSAIGEARSTNHDLSFIVSKNLTEEIDLSGGLEGSREKGRDFEKESYGLNADLDYNTDVTERLSFGAGYGLGYTRHAQSSEESQFQETGESHVLSGLTPALLENEFVAPGTVVVSNLARTQTFIENIDYRLRIVGSETRVERLVSGSIQDGQTVLVDYAYESGGTFDYDQLNQSVSLRLTFDRAYNLYMSYFKNEESLVSGRSARPLYTRERMRVGADGRHDLGMTARFRWQLELEKQNETLRPFTREAADADLTVSLPFVTGFANLYSRYEHIDNELSEEDTELTRYGASLSALLGLRSRVTLDLSVERDEGRAIPRETKEATLAYVWRWRLLTFSLDGKYGLEEQGGYSREKTTIYARLTRQIR